MEKYKQKNRCTIIEAEMLRQVSKLYKLQLWCKQYLFVGKKVYGYKMLYVLEKEDTAISWYFEISWYDSRHHHPSSLLKGSKT